MRRALGKGLSQLIGEQFESSPTEAPIDTIVPNQRQPRTIFADEPLRELAASIREHGILQPLLVRPLDENNYELIAGERRLRAAKLAGLTTVPILIRAAGSQNSLELALIENIQREDINALESARAYRRLIDEFDLTQEQVADKVGKSRTTVTNTLRLLKLPRRIQEGLEGGKISEGHARALLAFEDEYRQVSVFEQIVEKGLTVRDVESAAKRGTPRQRPPKARPARHPNPNLAAVEDALSERFGAPVHIGGGEVSIEYYAEEDLERILEVLGISL